MKNTTRAMAAGAALLSLGAGVAAPGIQALAIDAGAGPRAGDEAVRREASAELDSVHKAVTHVEGTFSFVQGEVSSTDDLARDIYGAADVLCGPAGIVAAEGAGGSRSDGASWLSAVGGDVENAFEATVGELAEQAPFHQVMGCSCAGNPADGRASGNADVAGFALRDVIGMAGPDEGVNTITFVSADGYSVSLPLSYVLQRASTVVYKVNGAPMGEALGAANQLWLGSTSARFFAQDVVEIVLTAEEVPPAAPGANREQGKNLPNVSVTEW